MTHDILSHAVETARAAIDTTHSRRFARIVSNFVAILRGLPDAKAGEVSGETIERLQQVADRVVDEIEQRLAVGVSSQALRQELAQAVYDIRSALEDVMLWRRHNIG